jgi:shikimate dehydrogenase
VPSASVLNSNKTGFRLGLAGRGILASRSPWLHESEAEAQGLSLTYELFDFDARGWDDAHLPGLLDELQARGFAGLNVTFPFKQAIIALLDDLSEAARRIGAVNTVHFEGGKRTGHNTDVSGFAESFRAGLTGAPVGHVLQIGCGGAGSATAHALMECGTKRLILFDQDDAKREELVGKLRQTFGVDRIVTGIRLGEAASLADGIVNATPMGMNRYPGLPLPVELIEGRHWVADIVYFPLETQFLQEAARKGCRALDGSGMAVHQAAAAFEIFTGFAVDCPRMTKNFMAFGRGHTTKAA